MQFSTGNIIMIICVDMKVSFFYINAEKNKIKLFYYGLLYFVGFSKKKRIELLKSRINFFIHRIP